jgi:putative membrane protein
MQGSIGKHVANGFKGSLIGAANTIPGVSGGTIAVITRLYDGLIDSVGGFFKTGWKKNLTFLLPVILGVVVGIVLFARVVDFFLTDYPIQTAFFFMGLILGSVPALFKITIREPFRPVYLIPFLLSLGLLVAMTVAGRPPASEPITTVTLQTGVLIFLTGVVSSATMIIPGVSGSFVMLLIGMYSTFIAAVNDLNIPVLALLVPGFVVGIVAVSKLIRVLLNRYHAITYWAIIGLVLGSVLAIWPRGTNDSWIVPTAAPVLLTSIASFLAGILLAYFLGSDRRPQSITQDGSST